MIKDLGELPMILPPNKVTNIHDAKPVYRVVEIYLTRWNCEACYRHIKQSYNPPDVSLSYNFIRMMTVIVHAIAYFTSVYMGMNLKLKFMVQKSLILSKKFFGIPTFFKYAMTDGIFELLKKTTGIETNCKGKQASTLEISSLIFFLARKLMKFHY